MLNSSRPEDAITEAVRHKPDLVLMDIDLGCERMDGTEAAKRILARCDVPIVFLTGHTEKEYVDRARSITRYGYIVKNSGDFVLLQSVEMAFELFEAHQELETNHTELSVVYQHMPVLMVVIDSERRIRRVNTQMEQFTGTVSQALHGMRPGEALCCLAHLDDPRGCGSGPRCESCAIRRSALSSLDSGQPWRSVEQTLPLVSDSGEEVSVTMRVSTGYFEVKGEPRVVVALEDITLLRKLEAEAADCRESHASSS